MSLTMGPGVDRLNVSALRSSGELRVVAPKGSLLQFKDITVMSSSGGAAMQAEHDLRLEGAGSIAFENVHSTASGAALRTESHCVYTHVAHLSFRNCSSSLMGGAIYGGRCIFLDTRNADDKVHFEACAAGWRGGAVGSKEVRLTGKGTYLFTNCHSKSMGGAVGTFDNVVMELQSGGSADFRHCTCTGTAKGWDLPKGFGGGAVYSDNHVNIITGRVLFSACSSESYRGHAMFSGQTLNIGPGSQVMLADTEDLLGPALFAPTVMLPPGGDVRLEDVIVTQGLYTSRAFNEHDGKTCPSGSRFSMDPDGSPVLGKCKICAEGSASLAQAFVQLVGEVTAPAPGMEIVLVKRSSPNSLQSLGIPFASGTSSGLTDHCRSDDSSCLGVTIRQGKGENLSVLVLDYTDKLALTFQDENLRARGPGGGRVAVPWHMYKSGIPLAFIQPGQKVSWQNVSDSAKFRIDEQGAISPLLGPLLVLGLDCDVTYKFTPADPLRACTPCHELATELADKIWCPGGAHVQSIAGYMLLHPEGKRTLEVHECPNKAACPGSNFSTTATGATSSKSRLCAMGYEPTPGCVRCAPHYGRPQLDPFVCKAWQADV